MLDNAKSNAVRPAVIVTLDECHMEVPPEMAGSLAAVWGLLERIALHSDRMLANVLVDGVNWPCCPAMLDERSFASVQAKTMSLDDFAGAVIEQVDERLAAMETTVGQAVLLVLINDRKFAGSHWRGWMSEARGIMVRLNFLEELAELPIADEPADEPTLARHLESVHMLNALAEVLLADGRSPWDAAEATAFSTVCEQHFLLWLGRLRIFLARFAKSLRENPPGE